MTALAALPTRRDEQWRYSDLLALEPHWGDLAGKQERITVKAGERWARVVVPTAAPDGVTVTDLHLTLEAGAEATLTVLVAAGRYGRIAVTVECHERACFTLGGAIVAGGEQTLEIVSDVRHLQPNGSSSQTVRSVLAGRATASVLGRVAVARYAQKTDATQSIRAMLLDRTATANAKPELEIFADDVQCAHGATVGELDEAGLYYLASRGLPPAEAKRLMLRAFLLDAFAHVEDEDERAELEVAASAALEAIT